MELFAEIQQHSSSSLRKGNRATVMCIQKGGNPTAARLLRGVLTQILDWALDIGGVSIHSQTLKNVTEVGPEPLIYPHQGTLRRVATSRSNAAPSFSCYLINTQCQRNRPVLQCSVLFLSLPSIFPFFPLYSLLSHSSFGRFSQRTEVDLAKKSLSLKPQSRGCSGHLRAFPYLSLSIMPSAQTVTSAPSQFFSRLLLLYQQY